MSFGEFLNALNGTDILREIDPESSRTVFSICNKYLYMLRVNNYMKNNMMFGITYYFSNRYTFDQKIMAKIFSRN